MEKKGAGSNPALGSKFGIEVKRLRYLPVTQYGAGSTPVGPANEIKRMLSAT